MPSLVRFDGAVRARSPVAPAGGDDYRVRIEEGGGSSRHTVTVTDDERERYAPDAAPGELVRASIHFLLEREPKEAILSSFSLSTIEGYFPEYGEEIGRRVG